MAENVTALATAQTHALSSDVQAWTPDQKALIKRTVAPDATDDELAMFLHVARVSGLDPLQKQIWFMKRRNKKKDRDGNEIMQNGKPVWEEKVTIQAGADGLQARALRFPDCEGIRCAAVFEKDDFVFDRKTGEVVKHHSNPFTSGAILGAWAIVDRKGRKPFSVIVKFAEYNDSYSQLWKKKPSVMIEKVARATALRRAYPEAFGNIYDPAEMGRDASPQAEAHEAATEAQTAERPALPPAEHIVVREVVDPTPEERQETRALVDAAANIPAAAATLGAEVVHKQTRDEAVRARELFHFAMDPHHGNMTEPTYKEWIARVLGRYVPTKEWTMADMDKLEADVNPKDINF